MVTLVYHPVLDPYHAIIRSLRASLIFLHEFDKEELEFYQFAILFPEVFGNTRLTASLRSKWKALRFPPRFPYESRPPLDRVIRRSRPTFEAAFQTLASTGALAFESDKAIHVEWREVDPKVADIVAKRNEEEAGLMSFLEMVARDIPFAGGNGLKDRSGLLEFRYDVT